jgi:hypothetical protein
MRGHDGAEKRFNAAGNRGWKYRPYSGNSALFGRGEIQAPKPAENPQIPCYFPCSQGICIAGTVGWVERSETHHGLRRGEMPMMGFAALNPSYAPE